MLTSLSEFKYYQSFRVPVESRDDVMFIVEKENDQGKMEQIAKVKLQDVSMTGLGFLTEERISTGDQIRCSIQFRRFRHEFSAFIVRAFKFRGDTQDNQMMSYGAELEKDDFPAMKKFIEQYVGTLPPERLKDSLMQLALTERFTSAEEGFEMFSLLLSLFKDITEFGNKEKFIESMLEEITRILNAQRASIFLINTDTNELEAVAALGIEKEKLKFDYRKGIAGSVFTTGITLNIDCKTDKVRFSEEVDRLTGYQTKSIICSPIHNREDKIIGVIEILNKRNEDRFTEEDEKTMKVLTLICSSVFHNYNPVSERSLIRRFSTPHDRTYAWVGRSPQTTEIRKAIIKVKDIDSPLFIKGESGTGKKLLARIVHSEGKRGLKKFLVFDCRGITKDEQESKIFGKNGAQGLLEEAAGGTVALAEIEHLHLELQSKLYSTMQAKRIEGSTISLDVRLIFTSSQEAEKLTHEGKLHPGLAQHLLSSLIQIDPLRKRKGDLEELVSYFMRKECRRQGFLLKEFSPYLKEQLLKYTWPGNATEMEKVIERAVLYNPKTHIITDFGNHSIPVLDPAKQNSCQLDHIPYAEDTSLPLRDRMILIEKELVLAEIRRQNDNKSQAAIALGISREALRKKLILAEEVMSQIQTRGKVAVASTQASTAAESVQETIEEVASAKTQAPALAVIQGDGQATRKTRREKKQAA
jgi:two-component system response regulator HydG